MKAHEIANKEELIKVLRWCGGENNEWCVGEAYRCPLWDEDRITDDCKAKLMTMAADALEEDEKQVNEFIKNETRSTVVKVMSRRISELEAQIPKWISVKNHLPEESGEYNVYIQMGTGVEVPDFFGSDDLSYVTSMYFKKEQKLWLDEYDEAYNADLSLVDTANDYHVSHWMPLPQKLKGE